MKKSIFTFALLLMGTFALTSCLSDGDETIILEDGTMSGIPSDALATPNPTIPSYEITQPLPNPSTTVDFNEGGSAIANINLTGIWDSDHEAWLTLRGTSEPGQNVWVSVDGNPKGIDVYNVSEDQGRTSFADVVFLVDNSGSMSEEADAIAASIKTWAEKLVASGIDLRVGCVGYDGLITGALNMTTVEQMKNFLDNSSGVYRTRHFAGSDASRLQSKTGQYNGSSQIESSMAALRFADEQFSFRTGANRIYINFTDEGNNNNGQQRFSVESLNPQSTDWTPERGTIHTVYSDPSKYANPEKPWLMSDYTGGTTIFAPSNFSGVTLDTLPVTGAMQNSYIIRFTNIEQYLDGRPHLVKITIVSADGSVKAEKSYYVTFGYPQEA